MTVEPIRGLPVLKDLIVDMEPFFESYRCVLPYLVNDTAPPDRERLQSPRSGSGSTTPPSASCAPRARRRARSSGPTGLRRAGGHRQRPPVHLRLARRGAPRNAWTILSDEDGRVPLPDHLQLHRACPRGIKVTKAIQEVKRAVMFEKL